MKEETIDLKGAMLIREKRVHEGPGRELCPPVGHTMTVDILINGGIGAVELAMMASGEKANGLIVAEHDRIMAKIFKEVWPEVDVHDSPDEMVAQLGVGLHA